MRLTFIGYWVENSVNPDGSIIYEGNPVYEYNGVKADGYWLLNHGFQAPLGDDPEVPQNLEHWFA